MLVWKIARRCIHRQSFARSIQLHQFKILVSYELQVCPSLILQSVPCWPLFRSRSWWIVCGCFPPYLVLSATTPLCWCNLRDCPFAHRKPIAMQNDLFWRYNMRCRLTSTIVPLCTDCTSSKRINSHVILVRFRPLSFDACLRWNGSGSDPELP